MEEGLKLRIVARMESEFPSKFGIPRQSGLVAELRSVIVFEPEWGFSPPGLPSGPIPWGFPVSGWRGSGFRRLVDR